MNANILAKANALKGINEIALKGEIVIFGSTYLANFPFYELANKCHLEHAIYNRSIEKLTTEDAEELLKPCVLDIAPAKVFLQLGEEDLDQDAILPHYRAIIRQIRTELPKTKIYLLGLSAKIPGSTQINRELKRLSDGKSIFYIPFTGNPHDTDSVYINQFQQLTQFFRDSPINLLDAFAMASI